MSGSKDRGVQFWDPVTGNAQMMLQGHKNSGESNDFSGMQGIYILICNNSYFGCTQSSRLHVRYWQW